MTTPASLKLGFYTYSYIDRLAMEIEPVLERVASTGFQGVDISATWRDDLDPAQMPRSVRDRYVAAADRLHLEIKSVVTHLGLVQALRDNMPLNLPGAVDVARDVGARSVLFHIGFADCMMTETGAVWSEVVNYLKRSADYAGEHGVVVALDGIWSSFLTHSPELIHELIDEVGSPALRHNFDPCYLALSGFDPADAAKSLAPISVHAHIKDYSGKVPYFEHHIPGEGVLDHARYLRALANGGFRGFVVSECFIDAPLERACQVSYQALSTAIQAAEE